MSVNLGTATGYLDLDLSKFKQGMAEAGKQAQELPKQIKGSMGSVGATFREIGGTIADFGQGMTTMITLPVVAAVSASIKQFASFEQAVGGVETMFKDNAKSVISNSKTAYKRAGVSGVEYMEQLTSFSASLLQGLGGDTEKASKIADMAMVDMSDNANKFGTDIGSIQDAYQGFAKQNYTMLDNLKLGYGGTASEMARLINDSGVMGDSFVATAQNMNEVPFDKMIEGIHKIQEGMGVTGTTLLEAEETISGSFGMMKASVMDFLAGMGSADADIGQLIQNMIDSFGFLKDNVIRVLKQMWDNLPLTGFQKWTGLIVTAAGPILLVIGKIMTGMGSLIGTFVTAEGVLTPFGSMMKGLVSGPFLAVVAGIAVLVAAFMDLWKNNEEFRNKIKAIWLSIQTSFEDFTYQIKEKLAGLGINFESFGGALKAIWDKITEFLAPVFIFAFETLKTVIDTALETILDVFDLFVAIFKGDWETAWNKIVDIVGNILNGLGSIFENGLNLVYNIAQNIFQKIGTFVIKWVFNLTKDFENGLRGIVMPVASIMMAVWNSIQVVFIFIQETFKNAVAFIKAIIDGDWAAVGEALKAQWELIKETFLNLWDNIKTIFSSAIKIIGTLLAEAWASIKAKLLEVWEGIKVYFSEIWDGIKTSFREAINAISEWFNSLPEKIGTGLTSAWENVKTWASDLKTKATETGENFVETIKKFFDELPGKIGYALGFALGTIAKFAIDTWNKAKETGSKFLETITTFFKELPGRVKGFIDRTWNDIKTWATNMWTKAQETGSKFITNIVTFFTQLPGKIKSFIDRVINDVKTWVSNMGTQASQAGTRFLNNVTNTIRNLPSNVKSKLTEVINNARTWVTDMGTKGKEAITNLWNRFKGAFNGIKGNISGIGRDIVNGVWNGISNAAANFTRNVESFFSGIVKGAKSALGIKSPSRVMAREIGEPMAEGAEVGFTGAFGSVMRSIQKTIDKEVDKLDVDNIEVGVEEDTTALKDSIDNSTEDMFSNVLLIFETIESKITSSINKTAKELKQLAYMLNGQGDYEFAYQAAAATQVATGTYGHTKASSFTTSNTTIDGLNIHEFVETVKELKDEVSKIKDMKVDVPVYLDGREMAKAQRDPIDNELGKKSKDKDIGKGRVN